MFHVKHSFFAARPRWALLGAGALSFGVLGVKRSAGAALGNACGHLRLHILKLAHVANERRYPLDALPCGARSAIPSAPETRPGRRRGHPVGAPSAHGQRASALAPPFRRCPGMPRK